MKTSTYHKLQNLGILALTVAVIWVWWLKDTSHPQTSLHGAINKPAAKCDTINWIVNHSRIER